MIFIINLKQKIKTNIKNLNQNLYFFKLKITNLKNQHRTYFYLCI